MPPLGMIMKLVEPVSDGTRMNSTVMSVSGIQAMERLFLKYLYAMAPKRAATTLANAGCSVGL